ncbi:hypothetical protein B484DRAFT_442761 [Ochromonadaceae sp. CCMP2298]|nr:hypothetical protein B484DRAFT_442761 [Ochromonadaceae sp. CCMP2298]
MDLRIGDNIEAKLVEISLFGTVAPKAATNFKSLCTNELGYGYKGSDIFRVISTFSLQGGSIGQPLGAQPAQRRYLPFAIVYRTYPTGTLTPWTT